MDAKELNKLVKRLQKGDESSFDEIYLATYEYVYYVILSIVHNKDTADELSQETYIRMLKKVHLYKSKNFHAWLGTMARNITYSYLKKHQPVLLDDFEGNHPALSVEQHKEELLMLDMKRLLEEDEMEIVILHTIHQYPHRKIAELMDKPIGTITWKYQQAIRKLQEGL